MSTNDSTQPMAPRFLAGAGPRAVERLLLDQIDALLPRAGLDPRLLASPVIVVVPSRALRLHVASAVVRHRGRALAGLAVRTHRTVALQILERAGERPRHGEALFEVLVARVARLHPALSEALDPFGDGYTAAALTVRDLLDAGFHRDMEEPLLEQLEQTGGDGAAIVASPRERARASALVRVAAQVHAEMDALGIGRVSTLLTRAVELLRDRGDALLPARAVLVHGFADAVGLVIDLLQELLRLPGSVVLVDRPPDPQDRTRADGGNAFSQRFLERLAPGALAPRAAGTPVLAGEPPQRELFQAAGAHAEVREVARRARALLDAGVEPEMIGVVARALDPYRLPVRLHFGRLGIPFSGIGATGPATGLHRRVAALLDLLQQGERVPVDRWLDCLQLDGAPAPAITAWADGQPLGSLPAPFDLRLALRAMGALRLHDVARLDLHAWLDASDRYALPVRRGLEDEAPPEDADEGGTAAPITRAPRRQVEGAVLRALAAAAQRLCASVSAWPQEAAAGQHLQELRRLLAAQLCWGEHAPDAASFGHQLAAFEQALVSDFPLERAEFVDLLRRGIAETGRTPVGGAGGGVRLLSVSEARACTFEHLFVLGVDRGAFPRAVHFDPLMPEHLRRALQVTLSDLPLKESGFDEERYLFAQLLEAAPHVTLSWLAVDDDGQEHGPSPLLWRVLGSTRLTDVPLALPWIHTPPGVDAGPLTAYEAAVLSGVHGRGHHPTEPWEVVAQTAIEEAVRELGDAAAPVNPAALARARRAIVHEFNRIPETSQHGGLDLGPWFGFVGAVRTLGDPRNNRLYVSTLEDLARCPWRAFLRRVLRLAPLVDPLAALPALDARLRGDALHGVLHRIVRAAMPDPERAPATVAQALEHPPFRVAWPALPTLEEWTRQECERAVRQAGVALPGLTALLQAQLRPMLELARQVEWGDAGVLEGVLGAEVEAAIELHPMLGPGASGQLLHFRADRADRTAVPDNVLQLTDYKSGRPLSDAKKEATRYEKLVQAIASGTALQAAVYAQSGGGASIGRYVYLGADGDSTARVIEVGGADPIARAALQDALGRLVRAWRQGALFPRLVEADGRKEPHLCELCDVKQACVRGDSGMRRRLPMWIEGSLPQHDRGRTSGSPAEEALLDLWALGSAEVGAPGAGGTDEGAAR